MLIIRSHRSRQALLQMFLISIRVTAYLVTTETHMPSPARCPIVGNRRGCSDFYLVIIATIF